MFSESNAAHPVRARSGHLAHFLNLNLLGRVSQLITQVIMDVCRDSDLKMWAERPLLSAAGCHIRPDHSVEYMQRAGGP